MTALKKIWTWFKIYWWVPVGLIVVVALLALRRTSTAEKILELAKNSREKQKKEFAKIEEEKEVKRKETLDAYMKNLLQVQDEYARLNKELDNKTKKRTLRITKKYKDKPEELARKFSEEFGINFK